jgi:hypothetical protein
MCLALMLCRYDVYRFNLRRVRGSVARFDFEKERLLFSQRYASVADLDVICQLFRSWGRRRLNFLRLFPSRRADLSGNNTVPPLTFERWTNPWTMLGWKRSERSGKSLRTGLIMSARQGGTQDH